MVPLYVAVFIAYACVRWWKVFTPAQCSGINSFASVVAVPFLIFKFVSASNPYAMNFKFLAADSLQKVVVMVCLLVWKRFSGRADAFEWTITLYSLATLPNTLVMGVPFFESLYGKYAGELMVQIVFLQVLVWCTLLLFLFELRAATLLIAERFPEKAGIIGSFKVDSGIGSLSSRQQLDAEIDGEGRMHVSLRRMMSVGSGFSDYFSAQDVDDPVGSCSSRKTMSFRKLRSDGQYSCYGCGLCPPCTTNVIHNNHAFFDLENAAGANLRQEHNIVASAILEEAPTTLRDSTYQLPRVQEEKTDSMSDNESSGNRRRMETPEVMMKMPSPSVMMKLALTMVWRKLSRNSTIYASLLGLVWALLANSSLQIKMPDIIQGSISIISGGGFGMIMFSIGIFMGLQPKVISCGKKVAALSMLARFVVAPAIVALTSLPFGLRGDLLRISILQAALPQAVLPFVFAKAYNVHPEVLTTSVIFGMLISLPILIVYFILLEL